jgi:hypothetical protein
VPIEWTTYSINATTIQNETSSSYVLQKQITVNKWGSYTFEYQARRLGGTAFTDVRVNWVSVQENSVVVTVMTAIFVSLIWLSAWDIVTIYSKNSGSTTQVGYVKLQFDVFDSPSYATVDVN